MTSAREERIVRNEVLFRDVNERIRAASESMSLGRQLEIFCECGRDDCVDKLSVEAAEYEAVRSNATRFIVKPGHQIEEVEKVTASPDGYLIVEKDSPLAGIARATEPRAT
jgi:hypothetical protein